MSDSPSDSSPSPQPQGILTQSLITSPMVNCILPARLRHKNHKDVVFVGEQGIQIKEALQSGHLEDVMENSDFEGSPLGAKVINVSSELPWEINAPSSEVEPVPRDTDDLPPQMLFMVTDSHEILFMYWSELNADFVWFHRNLPRDVNISEKYGRHIAVDPKSRAVAVSASRQFFAVFWLQRPYVIQKQMSGGGLDPIRSEKFFQVEGDILFMEFLYPKTPEDKRTLLLLIVHEDGVTKAVIFEWESFDSTPKQSTTRLPSQDHLPVMIVPLAKESSYLLINAKTMAMYTPDSSSRPMRYPPILPDAPAHQFGMWTRWARPSRNLLYSQRYDGIILCREDGWIYYLEFGNDGELETQTSLGQLHCDVDTAFDVLDMGIEGGDFLLAAGSQGDGGLFVQEARDHPRCVQRFVNWAPVTDAVVVPSDPQSVVSQDLVHDRLFVCSASASRNGSITELRYGIEARLGVSISLGSSSPIHDIWAIKDDHFKDIHLMVSDPESSVLLRSKLDLRDGIDALPLKGWCDKETMAMGLGPHGDIVQVTKQGIHLFRPEELSTSEYLAHGKDLTVSLATYHHSDGVLAMVTRDFQGNHFLRIVRMANYVRNSGAVLNDDYPTPLGKEPVSICYQSWDSLGYVFMGTSDGSVLSFIIHNSPGGITHVADTKIQIEGGDDLPTAISSIAAIRASFDNDSHGMLFCGLRSGILVPFHVDLDPCGLAGLRQKPPKRLGNTSINIKAEESVALFTCGSDFWRVTFAPDLTYPGYALSRVYITDQKRPAYFPTKVSGFSFFITTDEDTGFAHICLFCWVNGELLVCSLDEVDKPVPRRIDIPGNPNKMTYSAHLRSLIVSYSVALSNGDEDPLSLTRRPYIEFVDPDSQTPVAPIDEKMVAEGLSPWRPSGSPGEKVTCIFDWMPLKDGQAYHLVAIGTSVPTPRFPNVYSGRILLLQASRAPSSDQIICTDKHMRVCDEPAWAMTAYEDSLIVAAGKSFLPIGSKNSQVKWARNISARLPSPAVKMSVNKNRLFVTTSRHSLAVYELKGGDILACDADPLAHDGLSHCVVPGRNENFNWAFVSSRGGTVRVFSDEHGDVPSASVDRPTAYFPVSLLRLARGRKSPSGLSAHDTMYGFGINGSVYRLVCLNLGELHLLTMIVSLCMNCKRICPSLSPRKRSTVAIANMKKNSHIDGKILARLLEFGPDILTEMMNRCTIGEYDTVNPSVAASLRQAAAELITPHGDCAVNIFTWLRDMLRVEI